MTAGAAMLAATSSTTNGFLILIGVPTFVLGCFSIWDRVQRHRRAEEDRQQKAREARQREDDRRTIDLVASALFGPDKHKWPSAGDTGRPPVTTLMAAVANQVHPPNGKTVASNVEAIRDMLGDHSRKVQEQLEEQNSVVKDLNEGMAKIAVLTAEHVSDGHGGQRSW